jgi:hypothetical protein
MSALLHTLPQSTMHPLTSSALTHKTLDLTQLMAQGMHPDLGDLLLIAAATELDNCAQPLSGVQPAQRSQAIAWHAMARLCVVLR